MNEFAANIGLFIFRVSISLYMSIGHGLGKIQRILSGEEIKFLDPFGFGPAVSLYFAAFAEFFASLFIMFGILNRLSSASLIVTMSVAAFIAHADDPFSRKEKALMYLSSYLLLFLTGPGKYSLKGIMERKFSRISKPLRFLLG